MYPPLGNLSWVDYPSALVGGAVLAAIVAFILVAIFFIAVLYVYHSMAWMRIAQKLKFKKAWLAWIPFAGSAMRLHLGGFHWAWIFLILIPILGWIALIVLLTISVWRIFEKRGKHGWLGLSFPIMFIPVVSWIGFITYFVIIGVVAWGKK